MIDMKEQVTLLTMHNTYGHLRAVKLEGGTYQLELDDFNSTFVQHISKELYEKLIEEIKHDGEPIEYD